MNGCLGLNCLKTFSNLCALVCSCKELRNKLISKGHKMKKHTFVLKLVRDCFMNLSRFQNFEKNISHV